MFSRRLVSVTLWPLVIVVSAQVPLIIIYAHISLTTLLLEIYQSKKCRAVQLCLEWVSQYSDVTCTVLTFVIYGPLDDLYANYQYAA